MRKLSWLLAAACLVGCSTNGSLAPVMDGWERPMSTQAQHKVTTGETLYSIAWRYGLDYRELARLNLLTSPYKLTIGQILYLRTNKPKLTPEPNPVQNQIVKSRVVIAENVNTESILPITRTENRSSNTMPATDAITTANTMPENSALTQWVWPANGRIIKGFSNALGINRGLEIAGNAGDPIHAAANGKVVYSGSSLRGYGALLIIKHDDEFLSAYAHNRKLLVKEDEIVQAGQIIAEMGDSEASQVMLHFEIRQSGRPVDPLKFLPGRKA